MPLIMKSYQFASSDSTGTNLPKTYLIAGSNDGTTWYPIQYGVAAAQYITTANTYSSVIIVNSASAQSAGASSITTTTYSSFTTRAYTYFRLFISSIFATSSGSQADIGEWNIQFTPTTSSVSMALDNGTPNQLNIGGGLGLGGPITSTSNSGNIILNPNGGYVGIGTTSPGYPLQVNGWIGSSGLIASFGSLGNFASGTDRGTGNWVSWNPTNSGVVWFAGVNNADCTNFTIFATNGSSRFAGTYLGYTATAWSALSDERTKYDINGMDNCLDNLLKLTPISYRYKSHLKLGLDKIYVGFTAQDLESKLKYFGVEESGSDIDDEGNEFAVKYIIITNLIPYIVKGIQEQNQIVQTQQAKIQDLESRLTSLEARLAAAGI